MPKIVDMINADFNLSKIISLQQIWQPNSNYNYMNSARPDHGINLIVSGVIVYTFENGEKMTVKAGDVVYIPRHTRYTVEFFKEEKTNSICCHLINFMLHDTYGQEIAFHDGLRLLCHDITGEIAEQFLNICNFYRSNEYIKLKYSLYKLIDSIAEAKRKCRAISVADGVKYIEKNFTAKLCIEDIAKQCGMSETSFRRLFKKQTGRSPVEYIRYLKLEKAKELLLSSEITIDEISDFLGFYDKSYFYKNFKNAFGISPLAYKNQYLLKH